MARDDLGGRRVLGLVSLGQLLHGRLRDLREEREAEQILRFRLVMPTLRRAHRGRVPVEADVHEADVVTH